MSSSCRRALLKGYTSLTSSSKLPLQLQRPSPARLLNVTNSTISNNNNSSNTFAFAQATTRGFRSTAANMTVHNIQSKDQFQETLKNNKVVLVDFYATWCGPCKAIAPKIVEWSEQFPNIYYAKVDVDDQPEIAAEYQVRAMPTFLLFKDGSKAAEVVGAVPPKLQELIATNHPSS